MHRRHQGDRGVGGGERPEDVADRPASSRGRSRQSPPDRLGHRDVQEPGVGQSPRSRPRRGRAGTGARRGRPASRRRSRRRHASAPATCSCRRRGRRRRRRASPASPRWPSPPAAPPSTNARTVWVGQAVGQVVGVLGEARSRSIERNMTDTTNVAISQSLPEADRRGRPAAGARPARRSWTNGTTRLPNGMYQPPHARPGLTFVGAERLGVAGRAQRPDRQHDERGEADADLDERGSRRSRHRRRRGRRTSSSPFWNPSHTERRLTAANATSSGGPDGAPEQHDRRLAQPGGRARPAWRSAARRTRCAGYGGGGGGGGGRARRRERRRRWRRLVGHARSMPRRRGARATISRRPARRRWPRRTARAGLVDVVRPLLPRARDPTGCAAG